MGWERHPLPSGPVPDWLPDWRDPEPYAPSESRPYWAWQFLMRNPEYIADYAAFLAVPAFWPEGGKTPKFCGRSFAPWSGMEYYAADPPALAGETLEEYEDRMQGQEYSVTNLESGLCKKWKVEVLNKPGAEFLVLSRDPSVHPVFTEMQDAIVAWFDRATGRAYGAPFRAIVSIHPADPEANEKDLVPVWFDLGDNIDRQIAEARQHLVEERGAHAAWDAPLGAPLQLRPAKKAAGPQIGSLPTALRVYDAKWRGADRQEVEEIIFDTYKGPSKAEKQQKAYDRSLALARRLVAGGYRGLLTRG